MPRINSGSPSEFLFAGNTADKAPVCVALEDALVTSDPALEAWVAGATGWLGGVMARIARPLLGAHWPVATTPPPGPNRALPPCHRPLLEWLRLQRSSGRHLVLVTTQDRELAQVVVDRLQLFDEVVACDVPGGRRQRGAAMAAALSNRFGPGNFAFVGARRSDLPAWRAAGSGILVGASPALGAAARRVVRLEHELPAERPPVSAVVSALRPHQWLKNLLVFVPLLAADALDDLGGMLAAGVMFVAFCLAASAVYLINDLTDISADRQHPRKRLRPFASGALPLQLGLALAPGLAVAGMLLAATAGGALVVAIYLAVALLYTFQLKQMPLADIFALAALYTLRLYGGGGTTGHPVSPWLLTFSGFVFLSLAAMKRVSELQLLPAGATEKLSRRGYVAADRQLLEMLGISASLVSGLVLALYVQSGWALAHQGRPEWLWAMVPLMVFWQCRLWLATARGNMHTDPVIYAMSDWVSRLTFAAVIMTFLLSSGAVRQALAGLLPGS